MNPFILIDGSSYLYRAFHAMPSLTNSKGLPTGAIYGMINMLKKLLSQYEPTHVAVIFDAKGKTFRDKLYDKYKANRPAMPSELSQQIEPIHTIIKAMGVPILIVEGVEADDVIGTLAKEAEKNQIKTLISTGDKDLAQLVSEHTTLVNTMTESLLNPVSVKEKFGVAPDLIVDYLALIGDNVDNIPGVPLVGPKTAVKWLTEHKSLDAIIANAHKFNGKVGENLRGALAHLPLSRELATIKLDVPLTQSYADLKRSESNDEILIKLFQEYEFKNLLSELLKKSPPKEEKKISYEIIYTEKEFNTLLERLNTSTVFAFDTETTALDYMHAKIVGLSFVTTPHTAVYIPLAHDYTDAPTQLSLDFVLTHLKPIFENPNIQKIAHNLKYDCEILANYKIQLRGKCFDTMLESYILDSSINRHDMDSLALKYLGSNTTSFEDIAGKGTKQKTFNQIPIETAGPYAAEDADITLQLHNTLWPRIQEIPGLQYIFEEIELPLVPVLARMERNGVLVDANMLEKQTQELEKRTAFLEDEVFTLAGGKFNLSSPKQLQEILFDKLQLPILQKTPTGQASTADNVLQELAQSYELPKLIIEFRSLCKLITTYTKKLPTQINSDTGRIHTSYNQTGAATGRLSSSDPNLQNIPVKTAEGRRIRQAFIARPGYVLISADYSQIELRIMAHMSEDASLLHAFENNLDIHTATAAEVMQITLEQVSSEQRRSAKAINFGLIYGMSAFGLSKQLGIDRNAAQKYIDIYFARYPGVKSYMENTRTAAHAKGYVETIFGRRLYLPEINSRQIMRQKAAERAAINAPLQGSAADIIKRSMIALDMRMDEVDAKMIMQVHDELVFEVLEKDVATLSEIIHTEMQNAATLRVPLLVSLGVGHNWDTASGH